MLTLRHAQALDPQTLFTQYAHNSWSIEDGLPENTIFAIAQTPDGYLWLGTYEGLVRFDGATFRVFDSSNTAALKSHDISSLRVAHDGVLWIGSFSGGLTRFYNGRFTSFTESDGFSAGRVYSIYEDRKNQLWIGTDNGLMRYNGTAFVRYTMKEGLPNNRVNALAEDGEGSLWIGTHGGLSRFKNGQVSQYHKPQGLADESVRALHVDRKGDLWVGTRKGLSRISNGELNVLQELAGLQIMAILEDGDGSLWLGTNTNGLFRMAGGQVSTDAPGGPLAGGVASMILSLFEDREHSLWIGTPSGVHRLRDGAFRSFGKPEGLPTDVTWSLREDVRDGSLWVGTAEGLFHFKAGRFQLLDQHAREKPLVYSVWQDRRRAIWIGTADGLQRLKDGMLRRYAIRSPGTREAVVVIGEDSTGRVWFGPMLGTGLFRAEGENPARILQDEHVTDQRITAIVPSRQGGLWIGTRGSGIHLIRNGSISKLDTRHGLSSNDVSDVQEDRDGTVWICTLGSGLNRLKNGRINTYTKRDGLPTNTLRHVLADDHGGLWVGSRKNLFRLDKAELEEVAAGRLKTIRAVSYAVDEGIRGGCCSGGSRPLKTRDGKLWFPTGSGIAVVDPSRLRENRIAPPVLIQQVLVDREPIVSTREFELRPGRQNLEIQYTALSFISPERIRFRYRLENADTDWVDAGSRRVAYYNGLRPGRYRFRVIAANSDGIWNGTGAYLDFVQKPHFYERLLFHLFAVAVIGMATVAFYRRRLSNVRARFTAVLAERARISREIHDTLAQGLSGISIHLESVFETWSSEPSVARTHLKSAHSLARDSLADARRLAANLRPSQLEGTDLASALSQLADRYAADCEVAIKVETAGARHRLEREVENNLLRVFQEAVHNTIKHSHATRIDVQLTYGNDYIELRVSDNGIGFDIDVFVSGRAGRLGLIGMQERIEHSGGLFHVNSTAGTGTEIVARIPQR